MAHDTLLKILQARVKELGEKPALISGDKGGVKTIPWSRFGEMVRELALGLISLGVDKGERVAILSENRPEWAIADLAITSIGAVTVPIYTTLTSREIDFIIKDCGVTSIILSGELQLKKVLPIKETIPDLRIITIDDDSLLTLPRVMAIGRESGDVGFLEERKRGIKEDDLFTIIYTSGTTGRPKGVMLTHSNILSNVEASLKVVDIREEDVYLSFLPLAHSFERLIHLAMLYTGATIAYSRGFAYVSGDMETFKPTVMIGVPFFFERIKEKVIETAEGGSAMNRRLFWWAHGVGRKVFDSGRKPFAPLLNVSFLIANKILKKVRDRIGPGIRFFISGGAPLPKDVAEFFWVIGIPILEGYGLTETSPVVSVNTMDAIKLGTVGRPIPGVEVRIVEDGEIWIKGPNVMKGYFNMPEATSEVIVDGWFRTGDIGSLDEGGFLAITDREKDIIVTALGKNVAPQKIEAILRADEYIKEALVFGDRRPHLVVLIVPDEERLKDYVQKIAIPLNDMERLIRHEEVHRFYEERVKTRLRGLPRFEQIKGFALILGLAQEEITPTMKVKRRVVEERYRDVIEGLYKLRVKS
ncbi:MAG: long-chain fatty acid--CoA ligase [Deltaproteobacteria bacterium]|nr:long-chain fatty acid--CoA ligase [Deltaproteobacteria bacterium]